MQQRLCFSLQGLSRTACIYHVLNFLYDEIKRNYPKEQAFPILLYTYEKEEEKLTSTGKDVITQLKAHTTTTLTNILAVHLTSNSVEN